jgi:hypothetical protein
MSRDTTVIPFREPDAIDDPLSEVAREGARRMLAQVLIAEADAFVAQWKDLKLPDGRDRVVRHGHGPQRAIQTGIGPVEVWRAKVRDRADVERDQKIRFTSAILPKWARRTKSLDALLPILYLRGVSTGDFQEALAALLGKDAPNLSPAVIARLTAEWQVDYDAWQKRDLSARRYVYVWGLPAGPDGGERRIHARQHGWICAVARSTDTPPRGRHHGQGRHHGGRDRRGVIRPKVGRAQRHDRGASDSLQRHECCLLIGKRIGRCATPA